ncbi:MAG: tRNA guanosine(34) transglycosylase Tgt [Planctomycetota bacterium]|jgi:queuine tRNA-ribosyltransferase
MHDDVPTWQPGGGLNFQLLTTSDKARRGRFVSAHGVVETPAFMPVGTQGAVKTVQARDVAETGAQVVLANTYHMSLRDRVQLVERLGGLHALMRWSQTILTDSGGFQVFSLPERDISEDGVSFQYEQDGEAITLSPESSMDLQRRLGADIVMAFDECVDHRAERHYIEASVARTHRWLERCAAVQLQEHQHLFGIIQGGLELDLRTRSTELTCAVELPGYAIGGVSVGEGLEQLKRVVEHTAPLMPADKVRYLMGVGLPEDIIASVERGMDIFDCVIPTRYAREGTLFTRDGKLRIKDKKFRKDRYPIDTTCTCSTCAQGYARATLRYLKFINEPLADTLLTIHNLHFYQELMREIRAAIEADRFAAWRDEFLGRYLKRR